MVGQQHIKLKQIGEFIGVFSCLLVFSLVGHCQSLEVKKIKSPVKCEGIYKGHLQGVTTNGIDVLYWSWSDVIVKTNLKGEIIDLTPAPYHQGDLCFYNEKIYVAVNLGKFNQPEGQADSWVFVYDGNSLEEIARHPVPEVVHGAGGIEFLNNRFIVVGGLPPGHEGNYLYEYDLDFKFLNRHLLRSGYTFKGIQTATFSNNSWWFGCYGKPRVLILADKQFQVLQQFEFDASLGFIELSREYFLVGRNEFIKGQGYQGRLLMVKIDDEGNFTFDSEMGDD